MKNSNVSMTEANAHYVCGPNIEFPCRKAFYLSDFVFPCAPMKDEQCKRQHETPFNFNWKFSIAIILPLSKMTN